MHIHSRLRTTVTKAIEAVKDPSQRWRIRLFLNKQKLSRNLSVADGLSKQEIEFEALKLTSRDEANALQLTVRKLWRVGRLEEGLAFTQEIYDLKAPSSAPHALACAKIWHQYGFTRKGDEALMLAKHIAPDWMSPFQYEVENQRHRANLHLAVAAAETTLAQATTPDEQRKWERELGKLHADHRHYEEAVKHLGSGLEDDSPWQLRYVYALSLERIGEVDAAEVQYRICEAAVAPETRREFRRAELHFRQERHAAMLEALADAPECYTRRRLRARAHLFLGMFEDCAESITTKVWTRQLSEYRALALELSGNEHTAFEEYQLLAKTPVDPRRLPLILRRLARVAHNIGEYQAAINAELQAQPSYPDFSNLDDEVDPRFSSLARKADSAIKGGRISEALSVLQRLTPCASTERNLVTLHQALGRLIYDPDNEDTFMAASTSFRRVAPFLLPNAGESNFSPRPLNESERYSEAIETLPLSTTTILYESYHGVKTACNPLAICLRLLEQDTEKKWQHVWVIRDGAPIHPDLLNKDNVHFVRYQSLGYRLHLATAKYLINNATFPRWYVRRDGQRYLNTWHGVPWKHMGSDISADPFAYENVARNFLQASDLIFPNDFTSETLVRTQQVEHLLTSPPKVVGSPRMDLTFRQSASIRDKTLKRLGVRGDRPVVLYAPTWRGTMNNKDDSAEKIIEAVRELAKHDVDVIVRVHYFVTNQMNLRSMPANVRIAPEIVDTNEILGITNVLVSDYSSVIFDFASVNRPILKYVFDLEDYTLDRGLYFSVDEVPGTTCFTPTELGLALEDALNNKSSSWDELPLSELWDNPDHAADRAIALMLDETTDSAPKRPSRLLISMNSLNPNGITRSFRNLVANIPSSIEHTQILLPKSAFKDPQSLELAQTLKRKVGISIHSGPQTGTRQENLAWRKLTQRHEGFPSHLERWLKTRMEREFRRLFGETTFLSVVDFDGYALYPAALLSLGPQDGTRNLYIAHNEFCAEMEMRFPQHYSIGSILHGFEAIPSVSGAVMKANRDGLARIFNVPEEIHCVLPNTIDVEEILELSSQTIDSDIKNWLGSEHPHLIMVGRLSPEKNHETAFLALRDAHKQGFNTRILVLGDGPLMMDLQGLVSRLGLHDSVMFAGLRDNPYPAISAADGLLLSSKHEGQPMVFLEAMTLQTPIAATDIPASVSTLEGGKHGLIVPLSVEGVTEAIVALSRREVAPANFSPSVYRAKAVQEFERVALNRES